MHELALARALLRLVEPISRRHGAAPVSRVVLRLGPLSGADPALLCRAFPIVAAGTCAGGAMLQIEHVPIRIRCLECGTQAAAAINDLTCAACGATRTQLVGGDELDLKRVELQPAASEEQHV